VQVKNMNVYQLAFRFFSFEWSDLSRDQRNREIQKMLNDRVNERVFRPELSQQGLRKRQLAITYFPGMMTVLSASLIFVAVLPAHFIFGESANWFIKATLAVMFYLFGTSTFIALFRAWRASLDEMRFQREGQPDDFILDTRAYIRWYDFLTGIPVGLWSLTWW
jgi:hypothetical protein